MIFPRALDFPRSDKYLREELPKVLNVPRIMNALREIGKLSASEVSLALRPGNPPTLWPSRAPMPFGSSLGPPWVVPPDKSNRILLHTFLFEAFEKQSGMNFLTTAHVNAPKGTPGAREFGGEFDSRGMIARLGGSTRSLPSIGYYREAKLFALGASVLGALVEWGIWTHESRQDRTAGGSFAAHAYRNVIF